MTTNAKQARELSDLPAMAEAGRVKGGGIKVPEGPRSGDAVGAPVPYPPGPGRAGE